MSIETEPETPNPIEALRALSVCLRHLSCGWALHPAERVACLAILESGIPGADGADLAAATKILASSRRLPLRRRDQASQLSIRFAERAEALRESDR